jgi:hypothetical protein
MGVMGETWHAAAHLQSFKKFLQAVGQSSV